MTDSRIYDQFPIFIYEELKDDSLRFNSSIDLSKKLCMTRAKHYVAKYHVIESYDSQIIVTYDAHQVCYIF
jgi:hypothetical protein